MNRFSKFGESNMTESKSSVFATLVTALLGEVSPSLRKLTFDVNEKNINVKAYFDREISEDDIESMDCIETELLAHFFDDYTVKMEMMRYDYPAPLNELPGLPVYQRRE